MRAHRTVLGAALLALLLPTLAAAVFSEGSAQWVFTADRPRQNHPAHLDLVAVVPTDMPQAVVCAVYSNNLPKANKGVVETVIAFDRVGGTQGSFRRRTDVRNHRAMPPCVNLSQGLTRGDIVSFSFDMSRFQKLKKKRNDTFTAFGAVYPDQASAQAALLARFGG
ncbi:MAG: hypothetical protein R2991_11290 [Thermoanaerobaculia bacterium]